MRLPVLFLSLFIMLAPTFAQDAAPEGSEEPTLASLKADPANAKALKKGTDIARKFSKEVRALDENDKKSSVSNVDKARTKWNQWIDGSKESLGIDLYAHPAIVTEILDQARIGILKSAVKLKKGVIDWGSKPAAGYSRGDIAYALLVPKSYDHKVETRFPLVVTLHGRAINLRHPALKKYREQRSRIGVWNNWAGGKKAVMHDAIVIGPNGRPDGFVWKADNRFVVQSTFLGAGVGCTDFRIDPQGIFVEVFGSAIIDAVNMSTMFAGIILRDREDANGPPVNAKYSAIYENLNGLPLYYIADKAKWAKVGKPTAEALKKAYTAIGKSENLIIIQADRDANSALPADFAKMAEFLKHRRPRSTREFTWLFWDTAMTVPLPLTLTRADYSNLDNEAFKDTPVREKCGLIKMKVTIETEKVDGKDVKFNLMEFDIWESDAMHLYLYEPMVNLDLPVTVRVNGEVVMDKEMVQRDWKLFEKFCMSRNIYTYPVVAEFDFEFPTRLRIEPKPKEEEAEPADG